MLALSAGTAVDFSAEPISLAQEAQLREELAHQSRRILFNNDGGDARVPSSPTTIEELLADRTAPLIGSQVDTILYDTTAGTFGMFAHRTKVGEIFLTREGRYRHNVTPELIRQGTDPLQVMLEFAQEHDIEFYWVMRMNDTHDAGNPVLMPDLKREHPELLFGSPDQRPPYGKWTGVNYGDPRVRDLALRYIEEVAENYDVDGIHLDFCRHPVLFKRAAWGKPIRQQELDELTGLMQRIRQRLREIGAERGRPILLSVRVPDSVDFCRTIGIDLEWWLAEGLIDWFAPSGYIHMTRWEKMVALGHRHGVPVYPCLSESRVGDRGGPRNSLAAYRARAANVWQAGADGVYLFNMFDPDAPMLDEIGSPRTLLGTDKLYFISVLGNMGSANPHRYVAGDADFFGLPVVTPESPRALPSDSPVELPIQVGENIEAAVEAGLEPTVTLRLDVSGVSDPQALDVRLNGHRLKNARGSAAQLRYPVDSAWLRRGRNRLVLTAHQGSRLTLNYRSSAPTRGSGIAMTRLRVSTPDPHSLRLRVKAEATGEAQLGSFSIRTPGKGNAGPMPPGFEMAPNGYVYPEGWSHPGFIDSGPHDEAPQANVFAITLPMLGGEPGEYGVRVIAQNRPHRGPYFRDARVITFSIDEQGQVRLPRSLRDVQLRVQYAQPTDSDT